jgi:phosphatidylinositol alpha 1,6-mannosyltransferase
MQDDGRVHILVFTDTFFEVNGIGSYYRAFLDWNARTNRARVTIICPARADLPAHGYGEQVVGVRGIPQWRNPFYRDLILGYFSPSAQARIIRATTGPKVVHVATSGALGVAGGHAARRLRVPFVGYYHTDLQRCAELYGRSICGEIGARLGGRVGRFCDRLAYGRAAAMCVPSDSARETVRRVFSGPVEVIPNPIDTGRFRPAPTREGSFREKYRGDGEVLAVVVGRVAKEKNLDLVCSLLANQSRVRPVFVGDGPYSPTLRRNWGACITGFLFGEDLVQAYQQADVLLQLSSAETFGLTLAEGLACGLPAIVLRSQGLAQLMAPDNGVTVLDEPDLPRLADLCVRLVSDPATHRARAAQAREFALTLGVDGVFPRIVAFHEEYAR